MKVQVTGDNVPEAVVDGRQGMVIETNVGSVFSVNDQHGAVNLTGVTDWANVQRLGAVGDGTTDDTAALQSAINACSPGGVVYLPRGVYKTTATLDLRNGVSLRGAHANLMVGPGMTGTEYPCYIQPAAPFTGTSVIQIIGDADGGHPNISGEQRITDVMIDGSQLGGATVDGLYARGNVQNVVLDNVTIRQMPNNGIVTASRSDGTYPYSWRLHHVMVDNCHANGLLLTGCTDVTLDDVQVIGCWGQGFVLENCTNGQLLACRAEWNGSHGYHITGNWGDWAGSGGMQVTGCQTDRNGQHGLFVDATGNTPILITGFQTRRDGRNGGSGGGGFAGLAVIGATVPVTIDGVTCYPGVDDGGGTTNSPQYGVRLSGSSTVMLDDAYLHANTAGLYDDGTNTLVSYGTNITTAAGATTSTVRRAQGRTSDWANVKASPYNATGDGATDDTAAIQAAVAVLGSQGGTVYLPPGDYLLNGAAPLNLGAPITLQGAGHGATTIRIGSGFTGSSAITVSSDDCMIQGLQIRGASATTTSNPACHGVTATGVQEFRVFNTTFQWINGYALRLFGTAATTLHGTQINTIKIQSCAGGIHVKSDPAATAANVQLSNVFTRFLGVNSGANANLDGIRIEDSWDVLAQNIIPWMQATLGGTGAAFRVTGTCAAIFVQNLDALGPQTGTANVIIESGANGDPQNVQIQGGVIQQGIIGLLIAGASNQVRVRNMRILNNQTHNVSVTSTGYGIYLDECLISQGGAGATGTNYDINWTGTAEGFITDCRFGTAVVSTGTAGVQGIINIAAGTVVRVINANFAGSGSSSSNWYPTTQPQLASRVDGTNFEFYGNVDHRFASGQRHSWRPSASTNHVAAINVAGSDTNDRLRIYPDRVEIGPGATARDTTWGRQGTAQIGTADSDIIIGLAGKGLRVKEGTNAKMGRSTLAAGTVTVNTTAVTANSEIFLTCQTPGGTPGFLRVSARTAGASFTITSSSGTDTSVVAWMIVEPA